VDFIIFEQIPSLKVIKALDNVGPSIPLYTCFDNRATREGVCKGPIKKKKKSMQFKFRTDNYR
jgi:hypothetical protein